MSRVRFMELESHPGLRAMEKKIQHALEREGLGEMSVRLFKDQTGAVGYSVQVRASSAGKKALDLIHRRVCELIGYKRGRPPSEPTRQVKCRVPESVYRRLVAESKRRRITPSSLLKEWLVKHVG